MEYYIFFLTLLFSVFTITIHISICYNFCFEFLIVSGVVECPMFTAILTHGEFLFFVVRA